MVLVYSNFCHILKDLHSGVTSIGTQSSKSCRTMAEIISRPVPAVCCANNEPVPEDNVEPPMPPDVQKPPPAPQHRRQHTPYILNLSLFQQH